jgi:acetyl-CoA acyltransferase
MDAYIVAGFRSAVTKAGRGGFKTHRPDHLAADVLAHLVQSLGENFDKNLINDLLVGNAMPEAEQGLNVARLISLMGLKTIEVPGAVVNRYCSSGLETIAIGSAKIHSKMANCIVAGGVESMSAIAMGGWRLAPSAKVAKENPDWYWGMGLTAEAVAKEFKISREEQDAFAFQSHQRAIAAQEKGVFDAEIAPIEVTEVYLDAQEKRQERKFIINKDEGPRKDTSLEGLAKLKPVFAQGGSVTAGNSSQTSDGAAFVMIMSEDMLKQTGLKPIARIKSYHVAGNEPRIMGVAPIKAIPKAVEQAGLKLNDIQLVELNEAFASQSVAVLRELGLNPEIVNVNGGAIALGHPLGCTGAKLTVQMMHELKRRGQKYGVVSMCIGTGQGAAAVIEML